MMISEFDDMTCDWCARKSFRTADLNRSFEMFSNGLLCAVDARKCQQNIRDRVPPSCSTRKCGPFGLSDYEAVVSIRQARSSIVGPLYAFLACGRVILQICEVRCHDVGSLGGTTPHVPLLPSCTERLTPQHSTTCLNTCTLVLALQVKIKYPLFFLKSVVLLFSAPAVQASTKHWT